MASNIEKLRDAVAEYGADHKTEVVYRSNKYHTTIFGMGGANVTFRTKASTVKSKDHEQLVEYVNESVHAFFHGEE